MKHLNLPLDPAEVAKLRAGEQVLLTGPLYTGRDAACGRLVQLLQQNRELPVELQNETIYFVGPCPAKPGQVIGSAGPTTSYRMDPYTPELMAAGLRGMIGKGQRSEAVVEAIKQFGGVYFAAIGGAGALMAKSVKEAHVVAYEDLGTEAIRRLVVEDMPVIVAIDSDGNDIYLQGREQYLGRQQNV